ncbi:hypothetical protein ACJJTC_010790 [Scirpophaga incertulas]
MCCRRRPVVRAHAWRDAAEAEAAPALPPPSARPPTGGGLQALSLAHNQLTSVPAALPCRAPGLLRLNMAYNALRSMSYVTSYPTSLRQLDLSHNEISCWPSLPQIDSFGCGDDDPLACHCPAGGSAGAGAGAGGSGGAGGSVGSVGPRGAVGALGSARARLLAAACPAKAHLRLDGLRTLLLSNNLLTRIQLTTDDDGLGDDALPPRDEDWDKSTSRLVFPQLSMLDVSHNLLRSVPPAVQLLSNLAVLNISGNKEITDLPPQMGLLTRLWNLNAAGCSLQEPLKSMVKGAKRSADVVRYLRAVLTDAKPYAKLKLMLCGLQGIGKTSLLECLRQESAIQHRRKPTDHWAKRMGNKAPRRGNLSTVGVDIGTWLYEKPRSSRGPVTFRTWDFGGQQEYYATHAYFLSRRSLYLVVWRATDGRRGLAGALDWLRSIQARAPGSPVIMVATHYDQVANCALPESESPEALQRMIRCSIMGAPDADKRGLPPVLDSIEVSCSTRHNIRLLADIIYSVAFTVKLPGNKEPVLLQPVPASYAALEDCVGHLAATLADPVLTHDQYRHQVSQYMQQRNLRMFRGDAELQQATAFLHENGVLLHYDDANLKELYFVRPQWLCDVLAHVVSVREINPFVNNGVMQAEDVAQVFLASPALGGAAAAGRALPLLHKCELALPLAGRRLLLPALLPAAAPRSPQVLPLLHKCELALPLAGRRLLLPALLPAAAPRSPQVLPLLHKCELALPLAGRRLLLPALLPAAAPRSPQVLPLLHKCELALPLAGRRLLLPALLPAAAPRSPQVLPLLHKCELALPLAGRRLLLPALLPAAAPRSPQVPPLLHKCELALPLAGRRLLLPALLPAAAPRSPQVPPLLHKCELALPLAGRRLLLPALLPAAAPRSPQVPPLLHKCELALPLAGRRLLLPALLPAAAPRSPQVPPLLHKCELALPLAGRRLLLPALLPAAAPRSPQVPPLLHKCELALPLAGRRLLLPALLPAAAPRSPQVPPLLHKCELALPLAGRRLLLPALLPAAAPRSPQVPPLLHKCELALPLAGRRLLLPALLPAAAPRSPQVPPLLHKCELALPLAGRRLLLPALLPAAAPRSPQVPPLLHKCELALPLAGRRLLLPALLPAAAPRSPQVLPLLHKCELALPLAGRRLLLPALLPAAAPRSPQLEMGGKCLGREGGKYLWPSPSSPFDAPRAADSPKLHEEWSSVSVTARSSMAPVRRLVLLAYVPCGFWARLCGRLLGGALPSLVRRLYEVELEELVPAGCAGALRWGWWLWRTGLRAACGPLQALCLRELPGDARLVVQGEAGWAPVETWWWARVELSLPALTAVIRTPNNPHCQSVSLEPSPEVVARILALVSDQIDLLLEDWYPSLGTRFVHTSEGRCLISRLVPCAQCARECDDDGDGDDDDDRDLRHAPRDLLLERSEQVRHDHVTTSIRPRYDFDTTVIRLRYDLDTTPIRPRYDSNTTATRLGV